MDLTYSFKSAVPSDVVERYTWAETRNAAAVFQASNPEEFDHLIQVLRTFHVYDSDLLTPGGNRGQIPIRLDTHFERLGWRAVRIDMKTMLVGKAKKSNLDRSDYDDVFLRSDVSNSGYEVDNMRRRVALDVEWNAKDGNLDRDMSAYRALYDLGLIDVACLITRDHQSIRRLTQDDLQSDDAYRRLGTSTTTNIEKVKPRMTRGDGGGCPLLVAAISRETWAGKDVPVPSRIDYGHAPRLQKVRLGN